MSSLPARIKKIQLKMKVLVFTRFLPLLVYGYVFRPSRAANAAVHGRIWSNFEHVRDFMDVLVTYKNEKYPIKNECARVFKTVYLIFVRRAKADNSGVGGGIWPKFELIQAFMHVPVTCKNEDESSLWGFFQTLKGS